MEDSDFGPGVVRELTVVRTSNPQHVEDDVAEQQRRG